MTTDFLEVDALTPDRLSALLDRAQAWKQDPAAVPAALARQGVALLFEKPSARTRSSTPRPARQPSTLTSPLPA